MHRLGFGAMRITGRGIWGEPEDREQAKSVLRRAVELGVNFIDTADSYGPYVSEELIHETLRPYPADLTIATKGGLLRTGPDKWIPLGKPEYLRQEVEMSLRRLGVEQIGLYQLHRVDTDYPLAEQVGELRDMVAEGKIRHVGLSEVSVDQLSEARAITPIASVQNSFNLANRRHEDVLDYATEHGIGFVPFFPIGTGQLAGQDSVLSSAAQAHDATPAQLALAWLLHRSPVVLPIPGTSSVPHLEENVAAAGIELSRTEFDSLDALG